MVAPPAQEPLGQHERQDGRMILDTGMCSIYKITNTAPAGAKPKDGLVLISQQWYGELAFGSEPIDHTESLQQVEITQRIRVLQNRSITKKAVVAIGADQYQVERLYHGTDNESGERITDLSLSRVVSAYDLG